MKDTLEPELERSEQLNRHFTPTTTIIIMVESLLICSTTDFGYPVDRVTNWY